MVSLRNAMGTNYAAAMNSIPNSGLKGDRFNLARFVAAQAGVYERALLEIRQGRKRSHWMWYVYPQLQGLGLSTMAQRYGITEVAEAHAYLNHDLLGPRLITMAEAVLSVKGKSATEILGTPDDMKLRSCATLFAQVANSGSVFHEIIETYFGGEFDPLTLERLANL